MLIRVHLWLKFRVPRCASRTPRFPRRLFKHWGILEICVSQGPENVIPSYVIVIVQHLETELFLQSNGRWTKERSEATVFKSTGEAISFCVERRLVDVRIGMIFGDPSLDVFVYPFRYQQTRAETQELREENQALRARHAELTEAMKQTQADVAASMAALPLRRKRKRRRPDAE